MQQSGPLNKIISYSDIKYSYILINTNFLYLSEKRFILAQKKFLDSPKSRNNNNDNNNNNNNNNNNDDNIFPETRKYWVDFQWGIVSFHGERDPL